MGYEKLISSETAIFYDIPKGKPNRASIALPAGEFRGRVFQSPQKGETCWYYALNHIRDRIGPVYYPTLKNKREIEVFYSKIRKEITQLNNNLPKAYYLLSEPRFGRYFRDMDVREAKIMLDMVNSIPFFNLFDRCAKMGKETRPFLEQFVRDPEGTSNFYDYLLHLRFSEIDILTKALQKIEVNPEEYFEQSIKPKFPELRGMSWKNLSAFRQMQFLHGMLKVAWVVDHHTSFSTWTPSQTVDTLIAYLEEHGPHVVFGHFGAGCYDAPAINHKTIGEKKIMGWKPGTEKTEAGDFSHSVVLIGAEKGEKGEIVYFLDPSDSSDPDDPEGQKVYAISYRSLVENARDVMGIKLCGRPTTYPFPFAIY